MMRKSSIVRMFFSSLSRRQLDEGETRKYIRQVVSAVEHMHRANVVHRDLKLQNFMLNQNNDIIIIGRKKKDFLGNVRTIRLI